MRLTLRTLLAWMDGVLPADEQAQLGAKVEGSPVARQLVARIGACVGNPHLSAPRINGKGLAVDPDSVAEYLDNTLAPERLEAFETICLESDVHLAEVAACHAILAEVAKQPALLPPLDASHRRRLLEAMRHRVAAHPEVIAGQPPGGRTGAPRRPEVTQPGQSSFEPRDRAPPPTPQGPVAPVDATPSRTPWGAWALAGSALLLLAILAALLAQSAGFFRAAPRPREALARLDGGQVPAPPGPIGGAAAEPAAAEDIAPPAAVAIAAAGGAPRGLAELLAAADADPIPPIGPADGAPAPDTPTADGSPPTDEAAIGPGEDAGADPGPEVEATMPDPGPRKVRAGGALAIAGGVRPRKPTNPPQGGGGEGIAGAKGGGNDLAAAVGLEGDGGTAAESLGFLAADGLLLRAVAAGDRAWWVPIGVGTPLYPGETLIVPPGMQPELNLGGVLLRVLPRSLITLETAADGTPRVGVVEGRVVARAARGEARLGIVAGGIAGTVTAGLDGAVTAERATDWSPGLGEAPVPVVAELIAVGQLVRWIPDADGTAVDLPARGGLRWESAALQQPAPLPPGRVLPWGIGGERIDPLARNAAETLTTRLASLPPESDPAAGLEEVTRALAIDRRVENRVFAATLLALQGSYEVAVEVLCAEGAGKRLEGRQWQALEAATIPLALARGAESAARLRKAWEDRGPPGRADLLMAMARGPEDPDLAAGAGATLVEALASTELVVRRYALKNLVDIVEPSVFDRARFRPDAPEEARRDGVAWWRTLQEKGLVRRNR